MGVEVNLKTLKVSNPWREAIEDILKTLKEYLIGVSNPWREAIEEKTQSGVQSL